jgi:carbamoyl-phosphate synthase large subunit
MAVCGRLARQTPKFVRQCPSIAQTGAKRAFTTRNALPCYNSRQIAGPKQILSRQLRRFAQSAVARNQTQEAPNAQAYLNSGAIAGARDLVDVKKVLVIGSGGLSIGQAGEFDYSGT